MGACKKPPMGRLRRTHRVVESPLRRCQEGRLVFSSLSFPFLSSLLFRPLCTLLPLISRPPAVLATALKKILPAAAVNEGVLRSMLLRTLEEVFVLMSRSGFCCSFPVSRVAGDPTLPLDWTRFYIVPAKMYRLSWKERRTQMSFTCFSVPSS